MKGVVTSRHSAAIAPGASQPRHSAVSRDSAAAAVSSSFHCAEHGAVPSQNHACGSHALLFNTFVGKGEQQGFSTAARYETPADNASPACR